MRIAGIDPGLNVTGYGVVDIDGDQCRHVSHGIVRTRPVDSLSQRLVLIRDGVREALAQWSPEVGAVEASFVGSNARSALALGHARAAAILALADAGIEVYEYAPTLIKSTVTGYGRGDKKQIAEMVRIQLGIQETPSPSDAADALAVAITHWAQTRVSGL
ncbi:MAG TPA: crossover junction endodeoxyribonuclease RuvC [Dehalococcoidia bacterium]|nr:crossover junction endodeoxyribonuclease RuvC [Dehalococcoidia bacterium]|tara:strand:- start:482 stop:964 length:483 start_codon:yes stop_codon:yes gene_type:complete